MSYWEDRARENENKTYKTGTELTKAMNDNLYSARKNIDKEINNLVVKYMDRTELSYNEAMKYLTGSEFKEWKNDLKGYEKEIKKLSKIDLDSAKKLRIEVETLATKSRITRLDSLVTQIDLELLKKTVGNEEILKNGVSDVYKSSFRMSGEDLGKYIQGVNTVLDKKTVEELIQHPWSGINFSERIWNNRDKLSQVLKQEITQSFIQGVNIKSLTKRISDRMDSDMKNTERLVRTEVNYAHNQATKLSYEDAKISEYEFLPELSERTCQICIKLSGAKFKIEEMRVGVNYPPMHPRCRCSTIPVINFKPVENKKKETSSYTEEELAAIENYVAGDMDINNYLRERGYFSKEGADGASIFEDNEYNKNYKKELVERQKLIDSAINKSVTLKENVLYRSVDMSSIVDDDKMIEQFFYGEIDKETLLQSLKNKKITDKGYMSTTTDFNIARDFGDFTGSKNPIVLELNNIKNTKGFPVKDFFEMEDFKQKEILLERGIKYDIEDIYMKDGSVVVKCNIKKQQGLSTNKKSGIINKNKDWKTIDYLNKYSKKEAIEILKNTHGIEFSDSKKYPMEEKLLSNIVGWLDEFSKEYSGFIKRNPCKIPIIKNKAPSGMRGAVGYYEYFPSSTKVNELALNGEYHGNLNDFIAYTKGAVGRKFHPNNYKPTSTFIHEYGHHVSNSMKHITQKKDWQDKFIEECLDEFKKVTPEYTLSTYIGLDDYVSRYGTTSKSELFAESFAEYYGGENPRTFATIFGTKLDKILKGVK